MTMKFTPEFLDEIRARLPVSEVVGARVKLRKQGREWAGLSPFNAEKTPSFFVNDHKRFYKDFSSGKSGDIFTFLIDTEGLSFPEAVERLARQAGVAMPRQTPENEERERKRATLVEVMALAQLYFETALQEPAGARARGYLADRRIDPAAQQLFGIGYAPSERFALRDALAAKGVGVDQMVEAGLLVHGEGIAVPFDRFQNRVMFPIHDRSGKTIAFGGRAMEPGAKAKYLNSPETPLFHKGSVLFNHHRARASAHDKQQVIAVEGYVDAIAMTEAGFANVVAPLGTALTPDQCALLWGMAGEPILCFDGDKAGRKAAFRAIETALPLIGAGKSLRFALLPEGQDPDDLVRSSGPAAVDEALRAARPFADMLFARETEDRQFDTPESRAALERRLGEATAAITDETLRRHYQADMRRRLSEFFAPAGGRAVETPMRGAPRGFDGPRRGFTPFQRGPRVGFVEAPLAPQSALGALGRKSREAPREIVILAVALGHPALLERHVEDLAGLEFGSPRLAAFRDALVCLPAEALSSAAALGEAVAGVGQEELRARILNLAAAMPDWWCLRPEADIADAEFVLKQTLGLQRRAWALNKELKLAELALAENPTEQNFARLRDIKTNLADLAHGEAAIEGFGANSGRSSTTI
jgi:DNA primase